MTSRTSTRSLPLIMLLTLGLAACANTVKKPAEEITLDSASEITYRVVPGDQLGAIAERFTGRFNDWALIASHNGISDPRTLSAGQILSIPAELLDSMESIANTPESDSQVSKSATNGSRSLSPMSVTTGNGVSVVGSRTTSTEHIESIKVSPVVINRTFDLVPIDPSLNTSNAEPGDEPAVPRIAVRGTYYPKGIYEEPVNYARLIQRAAPGEVFPLQSKINDWYKITINDGVGYIRQSDSVLMD